MSLPLLVMTVLARSFVFLPGIGPVRETMLWRRGVESWGAYRKLARVPGVRPHIKARHDAVLEVAEQAFPRDPSFFARVLPPAEHWRAYASFAAGAAYLDIETTGDRTNAVTIVGVRHKGKSRAFVRVAGPLARKARDETWVFGNSHVEGKDYTPAAVTEFVRDATALVTFNGATFDVPVLEGEGVRFPRVPHVDLRTVFTRVGLAGGLKKIEEALGLARDDGVKGLSGYDAVKLWRRYEARGDEEALRTLVAYNVADFENLEPLAGYACSTLETRMLQDARGAQRILPVATTS